MGGEANLKPFKKGMSGNPRGRKPLSKEAKAFRNLTTEEYTKIVGRCLHMSFEDLRARVRDPNCTALEAVVCNIIAEAFNQGDERKLEALLNRLIGKVADNVNVGGTYVDYLREVGQKQD